MPNQANNLLRNIAQGLAALGGGISSPQAKAAKAAKPVASAAKAAATPKMEESKAPEPMQIPQQETVAPTLQTLQNQAQQFLGSMSNLARGAMAGGGVGMGGASAPAIGSMAQQFVPQAGRGIFGGGQTFASPVPQYEGIPMQNQYEMYNPFSGMQGGFNPMRIFRGANGEQYIVDPETGEMTPIGGAQEQESFLSSMFSRNAAPAPVQPDPMLNQNQQFMNDQMSEIQALQNMGAAFATPTPGQTR